jgi:glycerophosphoryl diester phosphodiesterase
MEAFRLAAEVGADGIELDAKLSADGQVIVFHDPTLKRLTGVEGRPGLRTFAELQRMDVGAWKGAAFRGARIPLLEEVFLEVDRRLLINVELTNYFTPQDSLVEAVVGLVRAQGMEARVLFSSFFRKNLARAKQLAPDVPCGHLVGPTPLAARDFLRGVPVATEAIHPYVSCATPGLVRRMHRAGRRVFVFTVNDPVRLRAMWRRGVDGVITDDPQTARRSITDAG